MASFTKEIKSIDKERRGTKVKLLSLNRTLHDAAKRVFDIIIASGGLIFLVPLFILVWLLVKRDSPGPAFFWCPRMGKNGRPFRMLKFRTMFEAPESYEGLPVTCKDDERITPIGHWLRDTKINELPQLWNVLIGEMSMVGPRPEDVGIAEKWPEELREEILSVRPGITSPASILYHDEENLLTRTNVMGEYMMNILPDKMRLDRLYVRNQSLGSDLDLIFWTLAIIIPQVAKAKIPEGYLFAGPLSCFFNRYVSWFLIDLVIALAAVGGMGVLWRIQEPLNWGINLLTALAFVIALIFSGFNSLTGLNRIVWDRATVEDGMSLAISAGTVTLLLIVFDSLQSFFHWVSMPPLPIVMIVSIGLVAQLGFMVARFRWRVITSIASRWLTWRHNAQGTGEKVLIVGAGEGYQVANWLLRRGELQYIFSIIGLVDDDIPRIQGMRLGGCVVLGRTTDLPDLVKKHDVGIILITTTLITSEIKEYVFQLCQTSIVRVAYIDNLIGSIHQQLTSPVTSLEHSLWTDDHSKFLALHDLVTGLPNRFLFQDQLMRSLAFAKRYNSKPVVLFIHLVGVKSLGEEYGKKICDSLLKEFTKRLSKLKRESDTLARLDEIGFGLILENIDDEAAVAAVAKRILNSTAEPIKLNEHQFNLNAKITFCTNLENYSPNEIGDIRRFYNQGKNIPLLEDAQAELTRP